MSPIRNAQLELVLVMFVIPIVVNVSSDVYIINER